jgi:hypothetical protein
MRKIIISMDGCSKCKTLQAQHPETESVTVPQDILLSFARAVGIQSMPFVVVVGEPHELDAELSVKVLK